MTSLMTRSVVLFLFCVIVAQCKDLPISFTDFTVFHNGYFDNIDQAKDGSHDRLQFICKPVLIPGLQKDPVLYVEEAVNGILYRRIIFTRNESSTDTTLYNNYYNFTDPGQYKFGTFNIDALANYTQKDFSFEGCYESYTKVSPEVLLEQAFDCRHSTAGAHSIYSVYAMCDGVRIEPPLGADESTSLLAYDVKRIGPRYPIIGAPEGYVKPCQ